VSSGRIFERLGTISRPIIWAVQTSIFAFSGITAFLLWFDLSIPPRETAHELYALSVLIVVKIIVFRIARLDPGWWRFVSLDDVQCLNWSETTRMSTPNKLRSWNCADSLAWPRRNQSLSLATGELRRLLV
jgi:hypothetical protein